MKKENFKKIFSLLVMMLMLCNSITLPVLSAEAPQAPNATAAVTEAQMGGLQPLQQQIEGSDNGPETFGNFSEQFDTAAPMMDGPDGGAYGSGGGGGYGKWTVKYYKNDGTDNYVSTDVSKSTSKITLYDGSEFTRAGYTLLKWNSRQNESGTYYDLGQKNVSISSDMNFYAVWKKNITYTITFNAGENGQLSGKTTFSDIASGSTWASVFSGQNNIPAVTPDSGYSFAGWSPSLSSENTFITQNYTFTATYQKIAKKEITLTANSAEYIYNGQTQSKDGFAIGGTSESLTFKTKSKEALQASGSGRNAGSYDVTFNETASNIRIYKGTTEVTSQYTVTLKSGVVKINPKNATVSANNMEKQVGSDDPAFTSAPNGFIGNEAPKLGTDFSLKRVAGETQGSYQIGFAYPNNQEYKNANYNITWTPGTLKIKKSTTLQKITVTGKSLTTTYNGQVQGIQGSTNSSLPSGITLDVVTSNPSQKDATGDGGIENVVTVKSVKYKGEPLSFTGPDADIKVELINGKLIINPKAASITITNVSKELGTKDPKFTATANDFLGKEAPTLGTDYSLTRVPGESKGEYQINFSYPGNTAYVNKNYTITWKTGTLTITKRQQPLKITVTGKSLNTIYNGAVQGAAGYTHSELPEGFRVEATTSNPSQKDVTGSEGIVNRVGNVKVYYNNFLIASEELKGGQSNEGWGSPDSYGESYGFGHGGSNEDVQITVVHGKLVIAPKEVSVSINNVNKELGTTDPKFTTTDQGFIAGEEPKLGEDYSLVREQGETRGTYKINFLFKTGRHGNDQQDKNPPNDGKYEDKNYTIIWKTGTLTIGKRQQPLKITVTGKSLSTVYNGMVQGVKGYTHSELPEGFRVEATTSNPSQKNVTGGEGLINQVSNVRVYYNDCLIPNEELRGGSEDHGDSMGTMSVQGNGAWGGSDGKGEGHGPGHGGSNEDVQIIIVHGKLVILPKEASVSVNNASKELGTKDPQFSTTNQDFIPGEEPELGKDYSLVREPGETRGTYKISFSFKTGRHEHDQQEKRPPKDEKYEDENYTIIWNTGTLTIEKAQMPLEITVTGNSLIAPYDGSELKAQGYTHSELPEGFKVEATTSNPSQVGVTDGIGIPNTVSGVKVFYNEHPLSIDGDDPDVKVTTVDGVLIIQPKKVTLRAVLTSITFGDPVPELKYEIDGLVPADSHITHFNGIRLVTDYYQGAPVRKEGYRIYFEKESVKRAVRTLFSTTDDTTGTVDGNYEAGGMMEGTLMVEPKTVNISDIATVAADTLSKIYSQKDPAFALEWSEDVLSPEENFSVTFQRDPGEDVGTYQLMAQVQTATDNYILQGGSAAQRSYALQAEGVSLEESFTINPLSLLLTVEDGSKVYGDNDPIPLTNVTAQFDTVSNPMDGFVKANAAYTLSREGGENAKTYKMLIDYSNNPNYAVEAINEANFTINPAQLTVKADNKTILKGEATPALTYTVEGLKRGDTITGALSGVPTLKTAYATGNGLGQYPIEIAQGSLANKESNNYLFSFTGGALTVQAQNTTPQPTVKSSPTTTDQRLPYTGDQSNVALWLGVGVTALLGVAVLGYIKRKELKNKK